MIRIALLLGLAAFTSMIRAAEVPAKGLVGYWNFDETTGTLANDLSGHGLHGTVRGAARAPGKSGGAIECKQDALVEVRHAAALDEFRDGITVSAWVKRDAESTWNMILSREVRDGPSEYFGLAVVKNKALFSVDPDGAHYQNIQSSEDMPAGEWIHLAGTYDGQAFKLYVNGRLAKSAPCAVPFKFADRNPLIIGGNTNTQGKKWVDCFHGLIDEVRLYNRALNENDISELHAHVAAKN